MSILRLSEVLNDVWGSSWRLGLLPRVSVRCTTLKLMSLALEMFWGGSPRPLSTRDWLARPRGWLARPNHSVSMDSRGLCLVA